MKLTYYEINWLNIEERADCDVEKEKCKKKKIQ